MEHLPQRGLNNKSPTIVFFLGPTKPLPSYDWAMGIGQARTRDTVLVKSREMTGRNQTLPWCLGGEGVKATKNKIHLPAASVKKLYSTRKH
jgi:hypothetical protein